MNENITMMIYGGRHYTYLAAARRARTVV